MRRVLPFVLIVVALFTFAGPAYGCSCAMLEPAQLLEIGQVAFVGTITGAVPMGDKDLADQSITFEVETVLAGEVPREVDVVTANNSAGCGIDATVGTRLAVFATDEGGQLTSSICSTTGADLAIDALGPGTAPTAGGTTSDAGSFDWQAAWLGAGGLAVVGGAWWLSRRR